MLIARSFIVWLLFASCAFAGERRFADPGEGILLNQQFILLEDGRYYAVKDKKVVPAKSVRTEQEALESRRLTIERLNLHRYWADGVPPEKTAVERYLEQARLRKRSNGYDRPAFQGGPLHSGCEGEGGYRYMPANPIDDKGG